MTFHEEVAKSIGSNHSDTLAVIRAGKNKAKKRTSRRTRRIAKTEVEADQILELENRGITDYWREE